jgi:methyl-accepting chemotaxis protein
MRASKKGEWKMNSKAGQALLLLGAAVIAMIFVKLMYDMNASVSEMAGHVGSLSRDVSAMKGSMEDMSTNMNKMRESMESMSGNMGKMSESMQRIDTSIQNVGSPVSQGAEQLQQWNPARMMR